MKGILQGVSIRSDKVIFHESYWYHGPVSSSLPIKNRIQEPIILGIIILQKIRYTASSGKDAPY